MVEFYLPELEWIDRPISPAPLCIKHPTHRHSAEELMRFIQT